VDHVAVVGRGEGVERRRPFGRVGEPERRSAGAVDRGAEDVGGDVPVVRHDEAEVAAGPLQSGDQRHREEVGVEEDPTGPEDACDPTEEALGVRVGGRRLDAQDDVHAVVGDRQQLGVAGHEEVVVGAGVTAGEGDGGRHQVDPDDLVRPEQAVEHPEVAASPAPGLHHPAGHVGVADDLQGELGRVPTGEPRRHGGAGGGLPRKGPVPEVHEPTVAVAGAALEPAEDLAVELTHPSRRGGVHASPGAHRPRIL
jgi:hypothetical protein